MCRQNIHRYNLQSNHELKPAALCGKIIKGIMLFTESHDGACTSAMTGSGGSGQSVSTKGDLPLIRVCNLKHKGRLIDAVDDNFSFIRRKLCTCFGGIFQSIGKTDGKLCRVNREDFRNCKMVLYGNAQIAGLPKISSECSI